jgi:predicted phosphodiesterase
MSLDLPTIRGNHERQLLACEHQPGSASDQFAFENTNQAQRAWLQSLPTVLALSDEVFLCHGTPASDLIYLLEQVDSSGARMAASADIERHADGIGHSLIICGHSHQPRSCAISGGRLVVNPGSVGLQAFEADRPFHHRIENGSPHARYAICEKDRTGWKVSHRCINYAFEKAAATARHNGREEWAIALETGRVS